MGFSGSPYKRSRLPVMLNEIATNEARMLPSVVHVTEFTSHIKLPNGNCRNQKETFMEHTIPKTL